LFVFWATSKITEFDPISMTATIEKDYKV